MKLDSIEKKVNIGLIASIVLIALILIFVDKESLNSLLINYDDNLVVNEVNILDVNYNNIVYQNTNTTTLNNTPNTSNPNVTPLSNTASMDYWAWPTDSNYTITTYYSSSHRAIDIYSYNGNGSNIYAANNGVVTSVKGGCTVGDLSCNGRGGNYIVINHNQNNYYTVYMHLKDIKVSVGDTVSRGQVIGTMGNTGNVIPVPTPSAPYLGTHLHFCLYVGEPFRGGYATNPMKLY